MTFFKINELHKASYNGGTVLKLMLDDIQTTKKIFSMITNQMLRRCYWSLFSCIKQVITVLLS